MLNNSIKSSIFKDMDLVRLLDFCPNIPHLVKLQGQQHLYKRHGFAQISNLGKFNFEYHQSNNDNKQVSNPFKIISGYMTQHNHICVGPVFMLSMITINNQLNITVSTPDIINVKMKRDTLSIFHEIIIFISDPNNYNKDFEFSTIFKQINIL
eukprot:TRINITY_DN4448_c0_g2_i1.p1 TRINITY_DN4448_c0_g2~~TRINITY_DN4448_c0_g2_i1.p1  ORF type:complete len:153 (+),score=14.06 TRINITY_DN4448_c0_g2_i1:403-861(+)